MTITTECPRLVGHTSSSHVSTLTCDSQRDLSVDDYNYGVSKVVIYSNSWLFCFVLTQLIQRDLSVDDYNYGVSKVSNIDIFH